MWQFLCRNKHAAAMLAVLCAAGVLALLLATTAATRAPHHPSSAEPKDISEDPHIFSTYTLPADERFMPSIGNGHVATNVFSDTVYMNGLYNGRAGRSHRARIPGYANVRLNSTLTHFPFKPMYSLHTRDAVFEVRVDRDRSIVTQRIYAHKYYTRTIVNQIEVVAKPHADPNFVHHEIWIAVKLISGPDSVDIDFQAPIPEVIDGRIVWNRCGQTKEVEDPMFQPLPTGVCVCWTSVPDHLVVPQHGSRVFTFAMTADKNRTIARNELLKVLQENGEELYRKHVEPWHQLYYSAGIDIEGNLQLSKVVNGMWYYLLSSLPSEKSYQPLDRFFGLSPGSLARGGDEDYNGHNFWDTEMWMFMPILMLYPNYARELLQYRLDTAYVATYNARSTGCKGYRYPWESAFTGVEVTSPCCPEVAEYEQHVSGCISFASRQYLAATRDEYWLKHGGCSIITNIADFWASRAIINYTTGLYDIPNVMGPDEDHANVTNSVFTNVVAGYSLYLAQYASCLCAAYYRSHDADHWADVAWSLALPFDQREDYHPEYSGYRRGERIKQADAVLLGYPLQYPMKQSTRINDLEYYEGVTRGDGPAMTWSMHAVGHQDVGQHDRADELFDKSYADYVREPFKVWSETRGGAGAVNFLTGMGGALQALLAARAGLRLSLRALTVRAPALPPRTTRLLVRGIKYLGANLTLEVEETHATLRVNSLHGDEPLTLYDGRYNTTLVPNMTVRLSGAGPFTISASVWGRCDLPADTIGHNYLRPLRNHTHTPYPSPSPSPSTS